MASTSSKKRKRGSDDVGKVTFEVSETLTSQAGPVLVNFPSIKPPQNTPFVRYKINNKGSGNDDTAVHADDKIIVAGETNSVEFFSSDETQRASAGCRYLVGVHNKQTGVTTLRPAPLHILTQQVKALKRLEPAAVSSMQRLEARAALGETFGTKKAKAAIKARERNKVDAAAMEGVAGHLQDRIEQNTMALPTQEEAKATADSARLIPPYNPDAFDAEGVYPLHNVIPEVEWRALSTSALIAANDDQNRVALLPYQRSSWVNQHLRVVFSASTPKKSDIKILLYIAAMLAFRASTFKRIDKQAVHEKLHGVPSVIIDGLLSRFTETARGSTDAQTTTQTQTTILTYMFALCLRVDDFSTDTTLIAADLSQPVTKINTLFRSLGCKIEKATQTDLKRLGLPNSASETKRAVLRMPLTFPQARLKRR
ncbi:hypothetical protein SERLA73DRAFT_165847 [Serpula lacrymans var. lacrymans S7.3]|uniref:RNA polymerase I associated factor, A49-like protein n=2 Tax=Serpula lacrymans var. lacrymans TaxID=341189 RepID=F8PMT6_SERL3|nr:hypothetical protein SERLA73DRAFT_165847 [Serpula lacrymans var. lacrymans S7.3]